jgi:hypothetical protein
MVQEVELPNGEIAEFPDNMSHSQISSIIQKKFPVEKKSQQSLSGWEKAANNPLTQGILGAGDELRNLLASGANLIPGVNIPYEKSGKGMSYELGKLGGGVAGFLGGGSALSGAKALSKVPGALKRAGGMAAFGALENPQDRLKGGAEGAAISAAIDALPLPFKAIGRAAEYINPAKYTKGLAENIASMSKSAKEKAKSLYEPIKSEFGHINIKESIPKGKSGSVSGKVFGEGGEILEESAIAKFNPKLPLKERKLKDITPDIEPSKGYDSINKKFVNRWYGPKLKMIHEEFLENPNLNNAHKLQSQMGKKIGDLSSKKMDAETYDVVEALRHSRDVLQKDVDSALRIRSPEKADLYKQASDIYKNEYVPFTSNPTLRKVSKGEVKTISPNQLKNALTKAKEKGSFGEEHYLNEALTNLSSKISKGKAAKDITSIVGGAGLGEALAPGIGGTVGGAVAGKLLGPSLMDLATNPEIIRLLSKIEKLKPYGHKGSAGLLADGMKNGKNGK